MTFHDAYFAAQGLCWIKGVVCLDRFKAEAIWTGLSFKQRLDAPSIFYRASGRLSLIQGAAP